MELTDLIIFATELVGTVAFAVSGGLIAIERKLDFFGIVVLATLTAVGGGLIRDLILGITPPTMFRKSIYVAVAFGVATGMLVLVSLFRETVDRMKNGGFMRAVTLFDAIGLGIFTVIGMNTAISAGYGENAFLTIFVGVTTGIGGGILRDVLAGRTPQVLRKEIYALAAILGGICYYFLWQYVDRSAAILVGAGVVIAIRLVAVYYKWDLPVANQEKQESQDK